jgi:hypothetical protein
VVHVEGVSDQSEKYLSPPYSEVFSYFLFVLKVQPIAVDSAH